MKYQPPSTSSLQAEPLLSPTAYLFIDQKGTACCFEGCRGCTRALISHVFMGSSNIFFIWWSLRQKKHFQCWLSVEGKLQHLWSVGEDLPALVVNGKKNTLLSVVKRRNKMTQHQVVGANKNAPVLVVSRIRKTGTLLVAIGRKNTLCTAHLDCSG